MIDITFAGETFSAYHLQTATGAVKTGDFLSLGSPEHRYLFKVETIQRECYSIESLKPFTNWVLIDEAGQKHYTRSLFGKVEVYRKRAA